MHLGTIAVTSIWIWLRNPTESTLSDSLIVVGAITAATCAAEAEGGVPSSSWEAVPSGSGCA